MQGVSQGWSFVIQLLRATLQPELCPECVTPLPHWGAALPGFAPLIAASY
ncbi:hypothetical protein JCM31598_32010 [Desulfonatronum parangueonense]